MLRLSKKADYALMALKHLAIQPERPSVSAREIADQYHIPVELLAKVLQRLVRRQLLVSHQGIRGGYSLARPAGSMSVADVIEAIDGPLTVTACSSVDERCDQYAKCNVRDPLWRLKDRIIKELTSCTIAEMANDQREAALPVAVTRKPAAVGSSQR